jgi:hypothetical protein
MNELKDALLTLICRHYEQIGTADREVLKKNEAKRKVDKSRYLYLP